MNYTYTKKALKALISLFLIQSSVIVPTQAPWYEQCFSKEEDKEYVENCKNMSDKIAKAIFLRYHCATPSTVNQALSLIQEQLTAFETQLIMAEQEALLAIKNKYQISDTIWQQYISEMQHIKKNYKNGIQNNHPAIHHDPTIPADIRELINKLLHQNGINPQSIHLKMVSDQEKIAQNPGTIAHVISSIKPLKQPKDGFLFSPIYEPYCIEIFPAITSRSTTCKLGYCAHEVQHIVQHSGVSTTVLSTYLKHYYNIDPTALKQTPEYHQLRKIHEAQAEVESAVKNPEIAQALKTIRSKKLYPNHLYEEHFFALASIDTLWKTHEWLKLNHENGQTLYQT